MIADAGSGKSVFLQKATYVLLGDYTATMKEKNVHVVLLPITLPALTNPLTDIFAEGLRQAYGLRDAQIHEVTIF